MREFRPWAPLISGRVSEHCRAVVVLPARDEAGELGRTIESLAGQCDASGRPMAREMFEVVLLLNNCRDESAAVARRAERTVRDRLLLHIVERELPPEQAHVGTARRLLMDTAWHRWGERPGGCIVSTDADTRVDAMWICENVRALQDADVVGGRILCSEQDLEGLDAGVRLAYERDQELQARVTEIESLLGAIPEDPWPRHRQEFGASLGMTATMYARTGGVPVVSSLEDVALLRAARRCGARVRHEPRVVVYTSSRLCGRVAVGLSGQLRLWDEMSRSGDEHLVPSAEWIVFRARMAGVVRRYAESGKTRELARVRRRWRSEIRDVVQWAAAPTAAVECCEEMFATWFRGKREDEIGAVLQRLDTVLERLRAEQMTLETLA